jgi:ligand-binding sensor domain-containing protein
MSRGLMQLPINIQANAGANFSSQRKFSRAPSEIRSVFRSRDGTLWVGTRNGLSRIPLGSAEIVSFGQHQGIPPGDAQTITEDASGDLWVGYDGNGAICISSSKDFTTYDQTDGLSDAQIVTLVPTASGQPLIIPDARPGLAAWRLKQAGFTQVTIDRSSIDFPTTWRPWHQAATQTKQGVWWSGSMRGLLRFDALMLPASWPSMANDRASKLRTLLTSS